jgi:outer membrane protein OmpA-like peptidoglycan-associated protein
MTLCRPAMVAAMPSTARPPCRLALAALLLLAARPAASAEGDLELFHGPDQSEWLTLRTLEVRLDGLPLPVPLPGRGHDPAKVLLRGPLPRGAHRLDVVVVADGDSTVFTYVDGLRFTMRGVLQLDVVTGDVVEVHTRVLAQEGMTVKWEDRYRLSLEATVRRSGQLPVTSTAQAEPTVVVAPAAAPAAVAAPAPAAAAPAAVAAPSAAAAPALAAAAVAAPVAGPSRRPSPRPATTAGCAVAPIQFAFDQSALPPEAEAALDRFSACLAASGRAVRVEGHCDDQGPDSYNEWLGAQRAAAAARHLRQRGVAPERITVRSRSAGAPVCTAADRACRARNRRVEIVVLD